MKTKNLSHLINDVWLSTWDFMSMKDYYLFTHGKLHCCYKETVNTFTIKTN